MWCGYDGHMGWGMAWMGLSTLVFLGLITIGIILLVKYLGKPTPGSHGATGSTAEQLLAERYARGEIDEQEYQQRLAVLRAGRAT